MTWRDSLGFEMTWTVPVEFLRVELILLSPISAGRITSRVVDDNDLLAAGSETYQWQWGDSSDVYEDIPGQQGIEYTRAARIMMLGGRLCGCR